MPRNSRFGPPDPLSQNWMNRIWSWDHCFNALALAPGHPDLAWDSFLSLFDHQDASGKLPDYASEGEVVWAYVKPPVQGWTLRRLCDKSGFAECFDALTGAGQRDRAYTWTASIFLLLASDFLAPAADKAGD